MHIACFIPSLFGGGAERVVLNLCNGWSRAGHKVNIVVAEASGAFRDQIPINVELVNLGTIKVRKSIGKLAQYIDDRRPDVLCSHLSHANIAAIRAVRKSNAKPKCVVVEHLTMSAYKGVKLRDKFIRPIARRVYKHADAIIAVSKGAARDLEQTLSLPPESVHVIYNPVVTDTMMNKANLDNDQRWFQDEVPVVLGVGRLTPQKDFTTLISAFAIARKQRALRLVLLGTGELQSKLESQVRSLGLEEDILLAGFSKNPYSWMTQANLFVLSSRWEALPTVLIEAMACGCNVVATDCPSGPAEILVEDLARGLVPVGDSDKMAEKILYMLQNPIDSHRLRAMAHSSFSDKQSCNAYLQLFEEIK